MKHSMLIIPSLLVGLGIGGFTVSHAFAQSNQNSESNASGNNYGFGGMMGYGVGNSSPNSWFNSMSSFMDQFYGSVKSTKPADANDAMKSSLQNATIDKTNNTITYLGKSVKILALGGAMDDNNSGPKEKFVIGGLVNPTLHIQKGTQVTLELINEDTDMPHGIEITDAQPPYGFMSMMQGGIYPGAFIPPIPAASKDVYPVSSTTFTANQSGTFNYICEYPGHAAEGMYGKIIVG